MTSICVVVRECGAAVLVDEFRGHWQRLRTDIAGDDGHVPLLGAMLGAERYVGKLAECVLCEFPKAAPLRPRDEQGVPDSGALEGILLTLLEWLRVRHPEAGVEWQLVVDESLAAHFPGCAARACMQAGLVDAWIEPLGQRLAAGPLFEGAAAGALPLVASCTPQASVVQLFTKSAGRWGIADSTTRPLPASKPVPGRIGVQLRNRILRDAAASGGDYVLQESGGEWQLVPRPDAGNADAKAALQRHINAYLAENAGLEPSSTVVLESGWPRCEGAATEDWIGLAPAAKATLDSDYACALTAPDGSVVDIKAFATKGTPRPASSRQVLSLQRADQRGLHLELLKPDALTGQHYRFARVDLGIGTDLKRGTLVEVGARFHRAGPVEVVVEIPSHEFSRTKLFAADGHPLYPDTDPQSASQHE